MGSRKFMWRPPKAAASALKPSVPSAARRSIHPP